MCFPSWWHKCWPEFQDSLPSHMFLPHIAQPTRISTTSKTLIDNIFSNIHTLSSISAWNYNTNRNNMSESLLNSVYLWSRARLAINKKQKYFSLPDHQLAETFILVFDFYEKNSFWFLLAIQCFFADQLKRKTVNKKACRIPSVNPRQQWAH